MKNKEHKLFIVDYIYAQGHQSVNFDIVSILSQNFKIRMVALENFYSVKQKKNFSDLGVELIEYKMRYKKVNRYNSRINSIKHMIISSKYYMKEDLIVVLAFDTIAFLFGELFLPRTCRKILFHHNNTDELVSIIKRIIFNIYKNHVYHFLFQEDFCEYLSKKIKVDGNKFYYVPHPIHLRAKGNNIQPNTIVGLCRSVDESVVENFMENDFFLNQSDIKIIIRSKRYRFESNNLKIINGFLEEAKYLEYLDIAAYILVLLPETFQFRISGSIYDAISYGKIVLTNNRIKFNYFNTYYPGLCHYISNIEDVISILNNNSINIEQFNQSYKDFINNHLPERIEQHYKNAICSVYLCN
nr:hypothetical protein [uncultured Sphaerochaeta sp.]